MPIKAWRFCVYARCVGRNHPLQVERGVFYIHSQLELEHDLLLNSNYVERFRGLFTIPRVRWARLGLIVVMIA